MLRAEQICVTYGPRVVLRDVSIDVPCGALTAIIGPNGSGKSTLLRTLAGELSPTRGRVVMAGRALTELSMRERARRRAVLPQHSALSFPFSCLDVVLLGRTPHEDPQLSADARLQHRIIARTALDLVGMGGRPGDDYDTLSGGQRQLVHLARVLAQIWEPPADGQRYLLLDEPTASLDLRHQHLILRCAERLARAGAAVLAIVHDVNLAAQYADAIAILQEGVVVEQGTPDQVLHPALLRDVFGVPMTRLGTSARPILVPRLPSSDAPQSPMQPNHEPE
jgi:iron complex transport system ATP-binding protein